MRRLLPLWLIEIKYTLQLSLKYPTTKDRWTDRQTDRQAGEQTKHAQRDEVRLMKRVGGGIYFLTLPPLPVAR